MDFRLLVFSRARFSPSSLNLSYLLTIPKTVHAPAGVVGPKGSNPFSQPPLVFILSVLKHPPTVPCATSLPSSLSFSLSSLFPTLRRPLQTLESRPPSPLSSSLLLLHFLLIRVFSALSRYPHRRNISTLTFKYSFLGRWVRGNGGSHCLCEKISVSFSLSLYLDFLCVPARLARPVPFYLVPTFSTSTLLSFSLFPPLSPPSSFVL